jgi:uncharacterized protein (TIGR03000 family)
MPYGGYGLYPVQPPGTVPAPATTTPGHGAPLPPGPGPSTIEPLPRPKEDLKRPLSQPLSYHRTASIAVDVPENAKVYIDGYPMKSTSARRVFTTPALEDGREYYYWVRVVVEDGGKKVEEVKKVIVKSGERAEQSFAHLNRDLPAVADAARAGR